MNNESIRTRLKDYCSRYHTPLATIGTLAIDKAHNYLISRFLKGKELNQETLQKIDNWLNEQENK